MSGEDNNEGSGSLQEKNALAALVASLNSQREAAVNHLKGHGRTPPSGTDVAFSATSTESSADLKAKVDAAAGAERAAGAVVVQDQLAGMLGTLVPLPFDDPNTPAGRDLLVV